MPGHRISRKEIKRNDLAETLSGITQAAGLHARSLAIAVGAVVLLGLAVAGGFWYSHSRAVAAGQELASVQHATGYMMEGTDASAGAQPASARAQDVITRADAVMHDYPSSKAARWAAYYKAVGQKEAGDAAGALATLGPLASDTAGDLLSSAARALQAQIREEQGDHAGAAEAYASLAASPAASFPVEIALAGQARALEAQGKKDEAAEIARRIQQEFADSPYARQLAQRTPGAAGAN